MKAEHPTARCTTETKAVPNSSALVFSVDTRSRAAQHNNRNITDQIQIIDTDHRSFTMFQREACMCGYLRAGYLRASRASPARRAEAWQSAAACSFGLGLLTNQIARYTGSSKRQALIDLEGDANNAARGVFDDSFGLVGKVVAL